MKMTNGAKASVWDAEWTPWGAPHSITGSATLDARFPGQWYQLEAGLHYNWHRHYDPTLGRYTQPDPLGFVDGPSVYAYVRNAPQKFVDRRGLTSATSIFVPGPPAVTVPAAILSVTCLINPKLCSDVAKMCARMLNGLLASKPPGYWNGPEGAAEWGRRNNVPPKEARRKFHDIKQHDKGSRGDDDYYVNPDTGDVAGPNGESAGNLGD